VHTIGQPYSAFYVVRTTSAKFGLHVVNMKFNAQNEVWVSIHIRDFRLPPRSSWELRSSGLLCSE